MKKIKFIYDTVSHDRPENRKTYAFDRMVDENESLRNIAIDIIKIAIKNGYDKNIFEKELESKPGLQISTNKEVIGKAASSFYFGNNGEVIFLSFYESLEKDWSVSELDYLYEGGYINNNTDIIYIAYPMGLGAGIVSDLVNIISSHLLDVILGEIVLNGVGIVKTQVKNKKIENQIKNIAKRLVEKNKLKSLKQLREIIESKESWELDDFKKILTLEEREAIMILDSLGYELSENSWYKSFSAEATGKRERWNKVE
ncbi:hypothetical protein [Lactococcus lactis]|uniref:hypothetical protein n=1 Tax=Lactococcus lactis TaxID=1358 RepID=UPI000512BDE0|nr:hypothetical protein [Lactococcus lactis]KGF77096.1 hypothetical protein Llab_1103 [Lactococcus lactis]